MEQPRRRAVVTGASRGIGKATALVLAEAGWDVAVTGRTVEEGAGRVPPRTQTDGDRPIPVSGSLTSTVAEVEARGGRGLALAMDLNNFASVRSAAAALLAWGEIDLVVNNAVHHLADARFLETTPETLLQSMLANHVHQVAFIQALLPSMVAAGGGTFVNIVSGSARSDPPALPEQAAGVLPTPVPKQPSAGSRARSTPSTSPPASRRSMSPRASWSPNQVRPAGVRRRSRRRGSQRLRPTRRGWSSVGWLRVPLLRLIWDVS